jgi:hypothetical protein
MAESCPNQIEKAAASQEAAALLLSPKHSAYSSPVILNEVKDLRLPLLLSSGGSRRLQPPENLQLEIEKLRSRSLARGCGLALFANALHTTQRCHPERSAAKSKDLRLPLPLF